LKSLVWAVIGILLGIVIGLPSGYAIMQNNAQSSNAALQGNITDLERQLAETQTKIDSLQGTNANLKQANEHLQQGPRTFRARTLTCKTTKRPSWLKTKT
jgi:TolA-binding protein